MNKREHFNVPINYFDNNATTFIYDKEVKKEIDDWINCGNPSNDLHSLGKDAKKKLDECRKTVADDLNVNESEVYFTGCASESNNIIISDIVNHYLKNTNDKVIIISDNIEHPSVMNVLKNLGNSERVEVKTLDVITDKESIYYATVDPYDIEKTIQANKKQGNVIALMTFMFANNETGAIQDIPTIGSLAKKYNIFFHCDATQAIGKMRIKPYDLNINAMTFSGHKFHSPKGVGVLYIQGKCPMLNKNSCDICSQFKINSQENGVRGGTENIAFIAALAKALTIVHKDRSKKNGRLRTMKKFIKETLEFHNCEVITSHKSLDNTLLIILKGISCCNKQFAKELSDEYHIALGVSSACQSGEQSHVLNALCVDDCFKDKVIRISMSDYNTEEEVKYLIKSIIKLLDKHRKTPEYNKL